MTRRLVSFIAVGILGVLPLSGCGSSGNADDESRSTESEDTSPPDDTDGDSSDDTSAATSPSADTQPAADAVDILTDFGDVCRGVKLTGATVYDPARAGVHPLITMVGEDPKYEAGGALLPDSWDPVIGEEQTVELVACLSRTASTLRQTCTGYLDDKNKDTGNTVEAYDASYDVRLIAATTGEVVASTQLDATEDDCPMFVFFDAGETVKAHYAEPDEALTAFLVEFVET